MPVPPCLPNQCPQCWQHAYDPSTHAGLGPREDCPQCVDHMITDCRGFYRK
ncbi:pRL2-8 [Streptomyces lasiicapitis]|uniref:pRL2-8 n=1 Tax=Streptomyces lasiicapitis TaxID=1923961 RepID=UPI0036CCD712